MGGGSGSWASNSLLNALGQSSGKKTKLYNIVSSIINPHDTFGASTYDKYGNADERVINPAEYLAQEAYKEGLRKRVYDVYNLESSISAQEQPGSVSTFFKNTTDTSASSAPKGITSNNKDKNKDNKTDKTNEDTNINDNMDWLKSLLEQQTLPEWDYIDPLEQARQIAEYQRLQRINAVNRMIDAQLAALREEESRVPSYYQQLRGNLATNREAALSGSEAMQRNMEAAYTSDRLSIADQANKMKQDALKYLQATGMADSGLRDMVLNDVDKIISDNIAKVMESKNITLKDIEEGKKSVQNTFTTALTNAAKEEQEYLASLARQKSQYEAQRGNEIFNISEEANAYIPVLQRQIEQENWARQMEYATQQFNQRMQLANLAMQQQQMALNAALRSMSGGGGGSSSGLTPYQAATLGLNQAKFDWQTQMDMYNMQRQNQPDYNSLFALLQSPNAIYQAATSGNIPLYASAYNMNPATLVQAMYNTAQGLNQQYQQQYQGQLGWWDRVTGAANDQQAYQNWLARNGYYDLSSYLTPYMQQYGLLSGG